MSNDITFCTNANCPMKANCKRADRPKVIHWISQAVFIPNEDGSCSYLIPKP